MRIRKQDPAGDYVFGHGLRDFWINAPDGVAEACVYRLQLSVGDWWLDLNAGTPWQTEVIGVRTEATRDPVIRSRILGTPGVAGIMEYSSALDRNTRGWSVNAVIHTNYSVGPTTVATAVSGGI